MISAKQNFCCSDHPSDPTKKKRLSDPTKKKKRLSDPIKKKVYTKSQAITTPNSVRITCWGVGIGNTLSNNIRHIWTYLSLEIKNL